VLIVAFLSVGLIVLPYPGIQNDEALFADSLYVPRGMPSNITVFGHPVAMMLMSYLGTLKSLIYMAIFSVLSPSVWSLRIPVLLMGALTIWGFYLLLVRVLDRRAGFVGCALLSTDATYLYTTCFDWGPVVLQHALSVGGILLLVRFHQTSRRWALGAGFFLFGLALWDKAIFGWTLIGLLLALLCAYPGALRRAFSPANLLIAALAFGAGAFPLLRFNYRSDWVTFKENVGWSTERPVLVMKAHILRNSLDGSGLLGYLSYEDPADRPRPPLNALEKLSVAVDTAAGRPRRGWLPYAMGFAVLLLPFLWRTPARRPMVFAVVLMGVVWSQMLLGRGVGAAVHHTALLWPWPHFLVAVGLAQASRRFHRLGVASLLVATALVCGKNVLAANVQFSQLIRNGGSQSWTDAIYGLSDYLPTVPARQYVILDWGILEPLRLLHANRLPLMWATDPLLRGPASAEDRALLLSIIQAPESVFISHTDPHEVFAGVNQRLQLFLDQQGYRKKILEVIHDTNDRGIFEVYTFVKK
jgi:hypothetical protein